MIKLCGLLITVINLLGCVSTGLPTNTELREIQDDEKAIVLLRVESAIEDQQPYEPFRFSGIDDNINFGLGTFETGGEPIRTEKLRFLSPESRRTGWTYMVLPHGTYYLAVYPPRRTDIFTYNDSIKDAPRWRIDVPMDTKLVYAGTLRLTGTSEKLLFEGTIMTSIRNDEISVVDDRQAAFELLTKHFPESGDRKVSLMRRHEGPIILRSPLPTDNE